VPELRQCGQRRGRGGARPSVSPERFTGTPDRTGDRPPGQGEVRLDADGTLTWVEPVYDEQVQGVPCRVELQGDRTGLAGWRS
jgi:hypothetical protein